MNPVGTESRYFVEKRWRRTARLGESDLPHEGKRREGGYSSFSTISSASPRFSTSQKSGYSLTTTSTSDATWPDATTKRSDRERASSQCSGESGNREPQCIVTHSHQKLRSATRALSIRPCA